MDYKKAGVDIEAGYKSVELIKGSIKETVRPEVLAYGLRFFHRKLETLQRRSGSTDETVPRLS